MGETQTHANESKATGKSEAAATPSWQQYLDLKSTHRDCLLLCQLGEFLECYDTEFGTDATDLAAILGIVLTRRPLGGDGDIPMAGVPLRTWEGYAPRLLASGRKIAIAEQIETPAEAHGRLIRRAVTRILTPGTLIEDVLLNRQAATHIAAIYQNADCWGFAYADVSCGTVAATEIPLDQPDTLLAEIARVSPAEILLTPDGNDSLRKLYTRALTECGRDPSTVPIVVVDAPSLAELPALATTSAHARCAVGAILSYVTRTLPNGAIIWDTPRFYTREGTLQLDAVARRGLELFASATGNTQDALVGAVDKTLTGPGGRLLRARLLAPSADLTEINRRLDAVEALFQDTVSRAEIRRLLANLPDLERLAQRLAYGTIRPRELRSLATTLATIAQVAAATPAAALPDTFGDPGIVEAVRTRIEDALVLTPPVDVSQGGFWRDGAHPELDELRAAVRAAQGWIDGLEEREQARLGIRSVRVVWTQAQGYGIEITNTALRQLALPADYRRKRSLTHGERFVTDELVARERDLLVNREHATALEHRLFRALVTELQPTVAAIRAHARAAAEIDVNAALAEVARQYRYVRPVVDSGTTLHIVGGRHPVVERAVTDFVPNDLTLSGDRPLAILGGANASGKSTFLRQVALIAVLAQAGSFVPAREAQIGLLDRIYARIGSHDEIARGRSTFWIEMSEAATLLRGATERSLLIVDEIGRGTSTFDGQAIAQAIVEFLNTHPARPRCIFATHYHEIAQLSERLPGILALAMAVREQDGEIVFLHEVVPGIADRSYGIHVARLAGIPEAVTTRADAIVRDLEARHRSDRRTEPPSDPPATARPVSWIEEAVRNLPLARMTPLEVMNKIAAWQEAHETMQPVLPLE